MHVTPRYALLLTLFLAAFVALAPAQTLTTIANFDFTDGTTPNASLIQGIDGSFYGTASAGGASGNCFDNCGTVFSVTPSGSLNTLHNFVGSDGFYPNSDLILGPDGDYYGTTQNGGANNLPLCTVTVDTGCGSVFKITPGGTLTTVYSFCSQAHCADGAWPTAGLVLGADGNFYGTTWQGANQGSTGQCTFDGRFGCGTVFQLTPSGTLTVLHSFCSQANCADGFWPVGGLVQATDGNLYGTTSSGGQFDGGTVYKITTGGVWTKLYDFGGFSGDGTSPIAAMVQALDGNFYGTTLSGGFGYGAIFKITPSGAVTTLHTFGFSSDGTYPSAGLIQANDGNLYGTTQGNVFHPCSGGTGSCGNVFQITTSGAFTVVHSFLGGDGYWPVGGLVQATDGSFYGTTSLGGSFSHGTVFNLPTGLAAFVETEPTAGAVGSPVSLLGTDLTGATSVTFNGAAAAFNVVSPSEITTTVPAGATTGSVQVVTPGATLTSNVPFQVNGPLQLVPVAPCRLVDTRQTGTPIQGGTAQSFTLPQLSTCGIPASAAAYSLNVTVVPQAPLGYLTIWPTGETQPTVSTMNSLDGRTKADATIVPASNNSVSVFASNTTDLVLDIDGYFTAPGSQTLQFYPLAPCRVINTRGAQGSLGAPSLVGGGSPRNFPVLQSSCLQGVSNPQAYSFNFTVVPTMQDPNQPLGYLTVWPQGGSQPTVSTLNNLTATVVANAAIVPAGSSGNISVFASNNTDLIVDINGYFAAPGNGGLNLYPVAPCRVLDTRQVGSGNPIVGQYPVNVVGSVCAPPASAQAYVFNATVVPSGPLGYLTLWPDGSGQPTVSTLNALDGFVTSNMAIVPTANGSIDAFASNMTQLVLDISSYFAP